MRRFLCIYLPFWSYQVLAYQNGGSPPPGPHLFVRRYRGELILERLCPAAARLGLTRGLPLHEAQARLGATRLQVHPFSPHHDRDCLYELCRAASWLSPAVGVETALQVDRDLYNILPQHWGITADITGTERIHADRVALYQRIFSLWPCLAESIRIAQAPTLSGAWALSRYYPRATIAVGSMTELNDALQDLPIEALRLPASIEQSLFRVGITTIAALWRIPTLLLARRFGYPLVERLQQCRGVIEEGFYHVPNRRSFLIRREFEEPLVTLPDLCWVTKELFSELGAKLTQHGRLAKRYTLAATMVNRQRVRTTKHYVFSFVTGTAQPINGSSWLEEHLSSWQQNLGQHGGAILGLSLEADELDPLPARQVELFVKNQQSSSDDTLFNNLALIVGRDNILGVEPVSQHLPERSFCYVPLHRITGSTADMSHRALEIHTIDRPTRLFAAPQQVVIEQQGTERILLWGAIRSVITALHGPERISSSWWEGSAPARDYFRLVTISGLWLWVFRQDKTWFVQGAWV